MKTLVAILTYISAVLSLVAFWRPGRRAVAVLLWLPKLMAGALAPLLGLLGGLGTALGLARREGKLMAAGLVAGGLAARFLADIPASREQFKGVFGAEWQARLPAHLRPTRLSRGWSLPAAPQEPVQFQRDVELGHHPGNGRSLRADLWQPGPAKARSGVGVIYAHGSGWVVGDKDLGTRHFFRHVAGQGHVILDVAYTLWPRAEIAAMISEVNQAVAWMKENGAAYGVNPERIVLMGGSAGGQLVLTAAYTPGHPAFRPFSGEASTPVCGVIAFYPAVDFPEIYTRTWESTESASGPLDRAALGLMSRLFRLQALIPAARRGSLPEKGEPSMRTFISRILGGTPDEIPETYRLLSPLTHVGPHCPPTLLLQGSDDVFELAPAVRRLHERLKEAGTPSILVEFPHTEHGFDLVLPRISPLARAATCDVERFLGLLA
jgi:acetyl esterase/lipase